MINWKITGIIFAQISILIISDINAQDIFNAAYYGNYNAVKSHVEENPDLVFASNNNGRYALEMAAQTGQVEIVKFLSDNGAEINQQNPNGISALHMASIYGGSTELIQLLLDRGAQINIRNSRNLTPLNYALFGRQKDIAEILLDNNAELEIENQDPQELLYIASSSGIKRITDLLVNDKIDYSFRWENGNTFLHSAAEGGLKEFAELLVSKGVDVNSKNNYGHAPIHLAAANNNLNMAEFLINKGADINAETINGRTALHIARANDHYDIVELLLENNADSNDYIFPELKGRYPDESKPGTEPSIFAPDIISASELLEHSAAVFSPNYDFVFWSAKKDGDVVYYLYYMKLSDGKWSQPAIAPFCDEFGGGSPVFSPDGNKLFYSTGKPYNDGNKSIDRNIWIVERNMNGWSQPVPLDTIINSGQTETAMCITADGSVYFRREMDMYKSKYVNGKFMQPQKLDENINSSARELAIFVPPDESYMLIEAVGSGGYGGADLFISYPDKNGNWSERINLGEKINSSAMDRFPFVSPDGKYLFFLRISDGDDIYWVSAEFIEQLRTQK
ncbi:ankyrin repeat domain-containing protein [Bacteroidota bacterium]